MSTELENTLPLTITLADGVTMTLLKDNDWVMRVQIIASQLNSTADDLGSVPPHWHDTHDEIHRVVKGRVQATLGSETRIYTPEDGEIFVPRGVVHSLKMFKGEDVIFEEKTHPMDGEKVIFYRNLVGDGRPSFMQAMLVAYQLDMYPGFPGHIKWLEKGFTTLFGGILAPLLGYKLKYPLSSKKQN